MVLGLDLESKGRKIAPLTVFSRIASGNDRGGSSVSEVSSFSLARLTGG